MVEDGQEIEIEDEPVLAEGPDINGVNVMPPPMPPSTYVMMVKSGSRLHEETCRMIVEKKDYQRTHSVQPCHVFRSSVKRPSSASSFRSSFTVPVNAMRFLPIGCLSCVGNATEVKP